MICDWENKRELTVEKWVLELCGEGYPQKSI